MPVAVYQFGDFRLDCGRFELLRNGRPLPLERKPMELLILLIEKDDQLVTRAEIAERLWSKEIFVDTEHGINTAVRKVRQVLGDAPESPRFVQTVTGKGYRFSAPVARIAPPDTPLSPVSPVPLAPASSVSPRRLALGSVVGAACVLLAIASLAFYNARRRAPAIAYTQLTDFTDSAVSPALSPDGRMLAFIRGSDTFLSSDQIYVKMLPNGEAKRISNDDRPKYGLAFSPDESQIAYTVLDAPTFSTYTVSVLGSEPHLLLRNAAGLVWLAPHQVLYSQFRSGIHLGVVTSTDTRAGLREIYFPAHQRGMAHYAYPSPDHRWALVVEMDGDGYWGPCRLVSLDAQPPSRSVGPNGGCTSAGWSPDGSWMYFAATLDGSSHLWRQRFPTGAPEQMTFGPTEEDGIAVDPRGKSLITSVGVHQSALWIHDPAGERQLSSEGEVLTDLSPPSFSPDNKVLYYLLRREPSGSGAELWRTSLASGASEALLPGISMVAYDVSPDGKHVVYAAAAPGKTTQLWLAPLDRSSPPVRVGNSGATWPHFANGRILFQQTEGDANYIEQMNLDGSHRSKLVSYPIAEIQSVSPGGRWVIAAVPRAPEENGPAIMAIPVAGGASRRLCVSYCLANWSTSGKFLFIELDSASRNSPGRTLAIPVNAGEDLPPLPPNGLSPDVAPDVLPGSQLIGHVSIAPGMDPGHFAFVNTTVHRNLYRISLP